VIADQLHPSQGEHELAEESVTDRPVQQPNLGSALLQARTSPTIDTDIKKVLAVVKELSALNGGGTVYADEMYGRTGLTPKRTTLAVIALSSSGLLGARYKGERDGLPSPTEVWLTMPGGPARRNFNLN
jgi:hypothetical protein